LPALTDLDKRLRAVEAERLELYTEWVKTWDQVLRYMKRAGALRQRLQLADEDGDEQDNLDEQVDLWRAKFGGR